MTTSNPKLIVILGPTAVGKSDYAVQLAKKIGSEIISADSRQVYKGLNIGTGKITKREMRGIKHYLLDVADPRKRFTVIQYVKLAEKAIREITSKGKIPIICGGTGFYIQALVDGIVFPDVPPNNSLRKTLNKKSAHELLAILKKLDPQRYKTIEKKNLRRVIRAIEIASAIGKVPKLTKPTKSAGKYDAQFIGLNVSPTELKERIKKRLLKRLKSGMISEARKLHSNGLSWKRMEELGLEYRYLAFYLQGKLTKEQMIEELNTEIWHYAKRQMTWFKRDGRIEWVTPQ